MSDILLGAIIGAGAVLAANLLQFLASWRTSKKADANWRRDQRRDAYADLIQAADDYRKAAHDLYVTPVLFGDLINRAPQAPGTAQMTTVRYTVPSYSDRLITFEDRSHLLDRAASRVNLLGSREVQGHVNALALHALRTMSNAAQADPKVSEEVWGATTDRFFGLYDAFLNAARKDLGFDALPPTAQLGGPTASLQGP